MSKKKKNKEADSAKFTMYGISIVISGTLFVYFLAAIFHRNFLVNFCVDAIVGALALAILLNNEINKHKMVKMYTTNRYFKMMDILSLALSILLKLFWNIAFDFTLLILFLAYILSKKEFEKL